MSYSFNPKLKTQWRIRYDQGGFKFVRYFPSSAEAMAFRMYLLSSQGQIGTRRGGGGRGSTLHEHDPVRTHASSIATLGMSAISFVSYPERIDT